MKTYMLLLPILVPLAAGVLVLIIPKALKWVGAILSLIATGCGFVAALLIFLDPAPEFHLSLLDIGRFSLSVDLVVTPLSAFILLFAAGFGFLICLYSLGYMAGKKKLKEYYGIMLFALGGTAGVLLADHLLILLIAWEIVTASLYFLVSTGSAESRKGATKSFAMLGGADACVLLGIGILWHTTGTFSMSALSVAIDGWLPGLAFLLMALGALTKAGALPLHSWIPAASEGAPLPVMALLPAAIDKLLGIYLLMILVTGIFVLNSAMALVLMIVGAITIIVAVMLAMVQHDLKKLLSYHAISQVGYMVLGIGTLSPIGILGGVFHMMNNSIYKSCLFLCAGSVEKRTGTTDLSELGGLAKAMPFTFISALVAALAISGVPPLNGFVSKWYIYQGIIDTGINGSFVFLMAAMFGSALTLASFVKVIYSVFLGKTTEIARAAKKDTGFPMVFPVVGLAALCLIFGIYYPFPVDTFITPVIGSVQISGIWSSGSATILLVLGLVVGLVIYLFGRFGKNTRTVSAFIGGEKVSPDTGRINGTHFYHTIRDLPALKGIYEKQEKERLDLYTWFGGLGLGFTRLLKALHNGILSWYVSWSVFGMIALIVLFVLLV